MANREQTQATRRRYDRLAPVYDVMEAAVEQLAFRRWRMRLWTCVEGPEILEIGVGTGKNLAYYPAGFKITAIDLSRQMMARAQRRATHNETAVDFVRADAQYLPFSSGVFDTALATFVFCSVPDPILGLKEVRRVVKRGGQVLLLEHVRINAPIIGPLMDWFDPLIVRIMGAHIARRTAENVAKAGLVIEKVETLLPGGLVKLIHARSG